jgi:hypothetical protein
MHTHLPTHTHVPAPFTPLLISTPPLFPLTQTHMFFEDDEYDTEDSLSSELDGDDSPNSTTSSNGASPPGSITGTVRRKSTNKRFFPTSEASLEKFFKYVEREERKK